MRWSQPCLRTAWAIPRVSPRSSAIACSARWTPTVPLALVSSTSLATNSGKSVPSTPAPPVWTQRSLSARASSSGVMPPRTTSTSGIASRASPCESNSSRLTPSATALIRSLCSSSRSMFRRMFIAALHASPSAPTSQSATLYARYRLRVYPKPVRRAAGHQSPRGGGHEDHRRQGLRFRDGARYQDFRPRAHPRHAQGQVDPHGRRQRAGAGARNARHDRRGHRGRLRHREPSDAAVGAVPEAATAPGRRRGPTAPRAAVPEAAHRARGGSTSCRGGPGRSTTACGTSSARRRACPSTRSSGASGTPRRST